MCLPGDFLAPWSSSSSLSPPRLFTNTKPGCQFVHEESPQRKGSPVDGEARQIKRWRNWTKIFPGQKEAKQRACLCDAPLLFFGNFFFLLPLRNTQTIVKKPLTFVRLFPSSVCCAFVPVLCVLVRVCECVCLSPFPASLHSPALFTTIKTREVTRAHVRLAWQNKSTAQALLEERKQRLDWRLKACERIFQIKEYIVVLNAFN